MAIAFMTSLPRTTSFTAIAFDVEHAKNLYKSPKIYALLPGIDGF